MLIFVFLKKNKLNILFVGKGLMNLVICIDNKFYFNKYIWIIDYVGRKDINIFKDKIDSFDG